MAVARPYRLSFSFLFLELVVVLLGATPSLTSASSELLERTCQTVSNKEVCNRYLLNAGWALSCVDTKCLASGIVPQLAKPRAMNGRFTVLSLSIRQGSPALTGCVDDYNLALSSLNDTAEQVNSGAYSEAKQSASNAETYIRACENRFGAIPTPVTDTNNEVVSIIELTANVIGLNF